MERKENDYRKICFYCASVYEEKDKEILTCPICGKTIHLSEYEKVMKNIRQAVFQGWTCRIEYEHEDNGRRYYTEQCGEILNFIALAIASGIIGNLSTDVVKKVFSKIGSYLRQSKKNHEDDVLTSFLESSEKINKFAEYISAYYDEYDGADTKTKNAILEEVFVEHTSHIIDGLIKMKHQGINIDKVMEDSPHSREEMMKMVLDIQDKVKVEKIEKKDFEGFWDRVDDM
ncbi:MAG: hypothetical protein HFJ08_16605 [Lachnospiraceae bacterium]|nr:hypothetical protein [Lachnospiraceae bacterium]